MTTDTLARVTTPVVVMDEAGHTGENLLDSDQPVYALAALQMDKAGAEAAVSDALGRAPKTMTELKFGVLRRSNAGRKNLLTLLDAVRLTADDAAIIVMHKPFMVASKLIDELVEPPMTAKGLQGPFYAGGAAKNMAHAFYELGPRALGEMYNELTASFVAMVRDYTPEAGAAFVRTLERCKIVSRDEQVSDLLAVMIDTPEQMNEEFAGRSDVLDPALPSLFGRPATGHPSWKRDSKCCTTTLRASSVGRTRSSVECSDTWRTGPRTSHSRSVIAPSTSRRCWTGSGSRHLMMTHGCRLPTS